MKLHERTTRFVPAAVRRKVRRRPRRTTGLPTTVNPAKDRSLHGKARIKARRAS